MGKNLLISTNHRKNCWETTNTWSFLKFWNHQTSKQYRTTPRHFKHIFTWRLPATPAMLCSCRAPCQKRRRFVSEKNQLTLCQRNATTIRHGSRNYWFPYLLRRSSWYFASRVWLKKGYPPHTKKRRVKNEMFPQICYSLGVPCFQTNQMSITGSKTQLSPPTKSWAVASEDNSKPHNRSCLPSEFD